MISVGPQIVRGLTFNPVDYAKSSIRFALGSIFKLLPNPFPMITLATLFMATYRLAHKVLRLKKKVKMFDILVIVGLGVGFDAMKRYRTQELFKENIENLAKQLDQAKQQLAQWEKWYQTVKGDLRVIEKSSSSLGKVGTKLSKAMANLTLSIEEGGKLFKQKRRVNKKVCLDLHHLIEKKKKNNQELKILIEELNSSGSKEVQKLIPQLEGFLSSWKAKRDRLQRLVDGLTKKCLSDVGCPHCKKKFVPLKAYVQQKRINNVAKSQ